MGLFTTLITLPLAPVRGTVWIAEQIAEEAERQQHDDSRVRRELLQLEFDHDSGRLDDAEYERLADALVQRLAQTRGVEGAPDSARSKVGSRDG